MTERSRTDRIGGMIEALMKAVRGDFPVRIESSGHKDDLDALTNAMNKLFEKLGEDTLERCRAEVALQESRDRYRRLKASIPGMFCVYALQPDGSYSFPYASAASRELFDIEPEELMREGTLLSGLIHPDDRERRDKSIRRSAQTLQPWREELRHIVNGDVRWYDWMSRPELQMNGDILWDGIILETTDRKRAEEALRESEASHSQVIENMNDALAVADANGAMTYVNRRFCEMLGNDAKVLIGGKLIDFLDKTNRNRWLEQQDRRRQGIYTSYELEVTRRDGSKIVCAASGTPLMDEDGQFTGSVCVLTDITARKRIEEALRMFQSSVDQASDAVFWLDREARFTYVNEQACLSLGYTREELMSLRLWDIDPVFSRELWAKRWEDLGSIRMYTHQTKHRRKDGVVFPVEVSAKHIRFSDSELHVAFVRDITERKRAEEERLELERGLLHSQKLESLGVLSGGIAHDFNNLLMVILGNLELTRMKLSPVSPVRDNIEQAIHACHRAADLTGQMLAYSGKGKFVVKNLDVSELVKENANLLKSSVSKNAILHLQLQEDIPRIEADAGQIQQVIMNLITNASEAIGENQGVITLLTGVQACDDEHLRQSRLSEIPSAGRFVYLEVADTGCGMHAEIQQRLFDPFFTTKAMGRGLGMSAILGIVRSHKGAIIVHSKVGQGTTIRVLLPVVETSGAETAPNTDSACVIEEEPEVTKLRGIVLVVDDEESVRNACKAMLEYHGLSVLTASDGEEAVDVFRRQCNRIDCVLLDLSMPRKDGLAALVELLRIKPEAKVILSSGYSDQDAIRRFPYKGLAGFIQKPYDLKGLRNMMDRVMRGVG